MKVAVVGATGLVGKTMIQLLEERNFPLTDFMPVASDKPGKRFVSFWNQSYPIQSIKDALEFKPDIALFSAGSELSLQIAPEFASIGTVVIDNSSAWRMDSTKKLVIPEINEEVLTSKDKIIANPNCSTIQMLMVIAPLHMAFSIDRIVVSTYQSVSGSGIKAINQLNSERLGKTDSKFYPHQIDRNCLPHIDVFEENGYTREEIKMVKESLKILNDPNIGITVTAVRVPVIGGHSESVNLEFKQAFDLKDIYAILNNTPGVNVVDDPSQNKYPMPIDAEGKDEVLVGRIRIDESRKNSLNLWIVADNLRKGAATNTIQIAESLIKKGLV
ncbi:MAG: aspartate-semialdehyde dehydrogenase [Bacteroidales bacterium]|nr:aspartate-semialdehyde dehydrogenase [Bacteroidales bacterium]